MKKRFNILILVFISCLALALIMVVRNNKTEHIQSQIESVSARDQVFKSQRNQLKQSNDYSLNPNLRPLSGSVNELKEKLLRTKSATLILPGHGAFILDIQQRSFEDGVQSIGGKVKKKENSSFEFSFYKNRVLGQLDLSDKKIKFSSQANKVFFQVYQKSEAVRN